MESTEIRPRGRRRRIGLLAVLLLLLLVGVATLWWTHEDTRVAVALGRTNEVVLVDPEAGQVLQRLAIPGSPSGVAFSPAGHRLLVTSLLNDALTVVSVPAMQVQATFQVGTRPCGVSWNVGPPESVVVEYGSAGQKGYSLEALLAGAGGPLVGQEVARGSIPLENVQEIEATGPDVKLGRKRDVVLNPDLTEVLISEGPTHRVVGSVPVGRHPIAMGWNSDDSKCFVVVNGEDCVAVVDPEQMRVLGTIPVGSSPNFFVRLEGPGLGLVLNQRGQSLSVIDMERDCLRHTLALGGEPTSLAAWPSPTTP